MPLLFVSIAVLFAGPLLDRAGRRRPLMLAGLDGFVLIAVAGLVFAEILPDAYGRAGHWVILAVIIGLFGPRLLEHSRGWLGRGTHGLTLLVAVAGLLLHAGIDGVALADAAGERLNSGRLGLAVVLHRIAVSVSVWVIVAREKGKMSGYLALCGMGAFTLLGFLFGKSWLAAPDPRWLGVFEGLVAGSLLHVLLHAETRDLVTQRVAASVGAICGVALLVGLAGLDAHGHGGTGMTPGVLGRFGEAFLHLALEVAPALALALGIVFLLQLLFPSQPWSWFGRGGTASQVAKGLVVGLPLPLCSCGVVPVYRQMARRGVPAAAGFTFLVATPEIGVDALLVSLPLLGVEFTIWRVVAALITALAAGAIVGRLVPALSPIANASESSPAEARGFGARARAAWEEGVLGLFGATAPWIILGIAIAALLQGLDLAEQLGRVPEGARVLVFALAGIPLYVCASGATPLVAVLVAQGVSPGAALAFLLTGPATNATTFGVLSDLHGRRAALGFGTVVLAVTVALGYGLDAVAGGLDFPSLEALAHHQATGVAWSCLGFLSALFLLILLRTGPRGLLGMILPWAGSGHHHDHGHDHGAEAQDSASAKDAESCCGHS